MENEPTLTREHMEQVKKKILEKHPDILEKFEETHDIDF
jgi:hypothetical protein